MRVLFIGGTGVISSAISGLAVKKGVELYLLNRGSKPDMVPAGARVIQGDIRDEAAVAEKLAGMQFDVVADFIAFTPDQIHRDIRLFTGKTRQFIFISSASAYQKPLSYPVVSESTPLSNPFWEYSRDKIACEEVLMHAYRRHGFPVTIVRPSHTYGNGKIPVSIYGSKGAFAVLERIRNGKKVIVHGDGNTLWTVTHNTDFAKAFVGLMGNAHAIGENFNITSDEALTWNQIHRIIGEALGVETQIVHIPSDVLAALNPDYAGGLLGDKAHSLIFDNSKIKRAVPGFTATTRFDEGVRQSLDYIYSQPELQTQDPEFDAWCDAVIEGYEAMVGRLPKVEK